jgi:hypothetical protein
VIALACLAGCSSSKLTCDLLKDPENCWAEAALAAAECFPVGEVGVLAADRASCTFSDGTRVVFDSPLPTSTFDLEELALTIERDGATCARFVDTFQNRMELTAGDDVVVSELHSGGEFHLHCGDGHTYEASFDHLFDCAGEGAPAPTDGFIVDPSQVQLTLASISTPTPIFRCTPSGT